MKNKNVTKVEDLRPGDLAQLTPHDRICMIDSVQNTTHNGQPAIMVKAHYNRDSNYEFYFRPGHTAIKREPKVTQVTATNVFLGDAVRSGDKKAEACHMAHCTPPHTAPPKKGDRNSWRIQGHKLS